jgi:TldD protein
MALLLPFALANRPDFPSVSNVAPAVVGTSAAPSVEGAVSAVEQALVSELERASKVLDTQKERPHYIALAVEDRVRIQVSATSGTLAGSDRKHEREMDVDVRVGTPELDSSHPLRGMSALREDNRYTVGLPLDDGDSFPLRQRIWRELDSAYRDAAEKIVVLRANQSVKVAEETLAPDFEPRAPVVEHISVENPQIDVPAWEGILSRLSGILDASSVVHRNRADLSVQTIRKTFVDSEGTRLAQGGTWLRVAITAATTVADGDDLEVFRALDFRSAQKLPSEAELSKVAHEVVSRLEALASASRGEPYSGPVMLQGKAAAVFVHEVLGHRVEGQRQKRDDEGKTFAEYVGRPILPDFLTVVDDPTLQSIGGQDLNGYYPYDDEGVRAERVVLAEKGVFKGFLMGRSPIPDFPHSNGHGRRQIGNPASARMGSTIVEATRSVPESKLRTMLIDEVRRAGLPYGVIVEEIEGGFTMTGRVMPNAFNVRAIASRRVWADGRPDELVRGIDLVGTPLVAFSNIVAAGDTVEVFNGTCGAESGWVPVSAASPSLLFRTLEFQLKEKGEDRPPLLVKPTGRGHS